MDGKTIQKIHDTLLTRWRQFDRLTGREAEITETEVNSSQAEIIDIAQRLEQVGRDVSLAEKERRELAAVERALAKMSSGRFGRCEECGEEIPAKRLMVVPEARLCAGCQVLQEKQTSKVRAAGAGAR